MILCVVLFIYTNKSNCKNITFRNSMAISIRGINKNLVLTDK